jgi:hypothetical protein
MWLGADCVAADKVTELLCAASWARLADCAGSAETACAVFSALVSGKVAACVDP